MPKTLGQWLAAILIPIVTAAGGLALGYGYSLGGGTEQLRNLEQGQARVEDRVEDMAQEQGLIKERVARIDGKLDVLLDERAGFDRPRAATVSSRDGGVR